MSGYGPDAVPDTFDRSRMMFESLVAEPAAPEAGVVTHDELELMRQLFQDHADVRSAEKSGCRR